MYEYKEDLIKLKRFCFTNFDISITMILKWCKFSYRICTMHNINQYYRSPENIHENEYPFPNSIEAWKYTI